MRNGHPARRRTATDIIDIAHQIAAPAATRRSRAAGRSPPSAVQSSAVAAFAPRAPHFPSAPPPPPRSGDRRLRRLARICSGAVEQGALEAGEHGAARAALGRIASSAVGEAIARRRRAGPGRRCAGRRRTGRSAARRRTRRAEPEWWLGWACPSPAMLEAAARPRQSLFEQPVVEAHHPVHPRGQPLVVGRDQRRAAFPADQRRGIRRRPCRRSARRGCRWARRRGSAAAGWRARGRPRPAAARRPTAWPGDGRAAGRGRAWSSNCSARVARRGRSRAAHQLRQDRHSRAR